MEKSRTQIDLANVIVLCLIAAVISFGVGAVGTLWVARFAVASAVHGIEARFREREGLRAARDRCEGKTELAVLRAQNLVALGEPETPAELRVDTSTLDSIGRLLLDELKRQDGSLARARPFLLADKYAHLALALERAGQKERAAAVWERAVRVDPQLRRENIEENEKSECETRMWTRRKDLTWGNIE